MSYTVNTLIRKQVDCNTRIRRAAPGMDGEGARGVWIVSRKTPAESNSSKLGKFERLLEDHAVRFQAAGDSGPAPKTPADQKLPVRGDVTSL